MASKLIIRSMSQKQLDQVEEVEVVTRAALVQVEEKAARAAKAVTNQQARPRPSVPKTSLSS